VEVKEWIMIISVILVIGGWFLNSWLNMKHEIFKKRLDYRLQMLDSYVSAAVVLEKLRQGNQNEKLQNEFIDKLEKSHLQILLYGSAIEIRSISKIVSLASQNNHPELINKSSEFMNLIRGNLRSELGIKNI